MGINDDNFDDFDDIEGEGWEDWEDSSEFEQYSEDMNNLYNKLFPEDGSKPEGSKLIESIEIEKNGNIYLEEKWEYDGATITKITLQTNTEVKYESGVEEYNNKLVEQMNSLKKEIEVAVKKEDYEHAAELQKRLKSIEEFILKK